MTGARTRRWARRILLGIVVMAALAVLASWAFVKFQPTSAAPALPTASASSPAAPVDGTWAVSAGSIAGFRVRETIFGMSNDVVGRTSGSAAPSWCPPAGSRARRSASTSPRSR